MIKVWDRLYLGSRTSCGQGIATVHACKDPCHKRAVGYRGHLDPHNEHYLVKRIGDQLYLNMVDADKPIFMPMTFRVFRDFMVEQWNQGREVLIHCNRGRSRSPSLAMLFLAKDLKVIRNGSAEEAALDFRELYPEFRPSRGIGLYLSRNWGML